MAYELHLELAEFKWHKIYFTRILEMKFYSFSYPFFGNETEQQVRELYEFGRIIEIRKGR